MSDMERYGDYNEVDDEPVESGKVKKVISLIIKILIGVAVAAVVGFFVFRIAIFNYYPKSLSALYYTDALTDYYNKNGGITVKTQSNDTRYDDATEGNFWFDKVLIVPDADHLQFTLRYNTSLYEKIEEEYGIKIPADADPTEIFEFELVRPIGNEASRDEEIPVVKAGTLTGTKTESNLMYRYVKLAFDNVDADFNAYHPVEGHDTDDCTDADGNGHCDICGLLPWLRLHITLKDFDYEAYNAKIEAEGKTDGKKYPFMLAVYVGRTPLVDHAIGKGEVPGK